jgi:spore germination protein
MKNLIITIIIFLFTANSFAKRPERLFYLTNDIASGSLLNANTLQQISAHAKLIDIIAPQIYVLDKTGVIWGSLDPELIKITQKKHIKVMPLVVNNNFNQLILHDFLHNSGAQKRAIDQMLALCRKYKFYGIQFDFENIQISDKEAFTQFFKYAANILHQNNFIISVAVVPRVNEFSNYNDFDRWYLENWSGAYDYPHLAQASDFITIMAYDKHTSLTTPGPVAPLDWVEQIIKAFLKIIPAEKISLGVPVYSGYWKTDKLGGSSDKSCMEKYSFRSKEVQIGYAELLSLLARTTKPLSWDEQAKTSYVIVNPHGLYEYIFIENVRSFKAKFEMAEHYHLRGVSVWKLGMEDPKIWGLDLNTLP